MFYADRLTTRNVGNTDLLYNRPISYYTGKRTVELYSYEFYWYLTAIFKIDRVSNVWTLYKQPLE